MSELRHEPKDEVIELLPVMTEEVQDEKDEKKIKTNQPTPEQERLNENANAYNAAFKGNGLYQREYNRILKELNNDNATDPVSNQEKARIGTYLHFNPITYSSPASSSPIHSDQKPNKNLSIDLEEGLGGDVKSAPETKEPKRPFRPATPKSILEDVDPKATSNRTYNAQIYHLLHRNDADYIRIFDEQTSAASKKTSGFLDLNAILRETYQAHSELENKRLKGEASEIKMDISSKKLPTSKKDLAKIFQSGDEEQDHLIYQSLKQLTNEKNITKYKEIYGVELSTALDQGKTKEEATTFAKRETFQKMVARKIIKLSDNEATTSAIEDDIKHAKKEKEEVKRKQGIGYAAEYTIYGGMTIGTVVKTWERRVDNLGKKDWLPSRSIVKEQSGRSKGRAALKSGYPHNLTNEGIQNVGVSYNQIGGIGDKERKDLAMLEAMKDQTVDLEGTSDPSKKNFFSSLNQSYTYMEELRWIYLDSIPMLQTRVNEELHARCNKILLSEKSPNEIARAIKEEIQKAQEGKKKIAELTELAADIQQGLGVATLVTGRVSNLARTIHRIGHYLFYSCCESQYREAGYTPYSKGMEKLHLPCISQLCGFLILAASLPTTGVVKQGFDFTTAILQYSSQILTSALDIRNKGLTEEERLEKWAIINRASKRLAPAALALFVFGVIYGPGHILSALGPLKAVHTAVRASSYAPTAANFAKVFAANWVGAGSVIFGTQAIIAQIAKRQINNLKEPMLRELDEQLADLDQQYEAARASFRRSQQLRSSQITKILDKSKSSEGQPKSEDQSQSGDLPKWDRQRSALSSIKESSTHEEETEDREVLLGETRSNDIGVDLALSAGEQAPGRRTSTTDSVFASSSVLFTPLKPDSTSGKTNENSIIVKPEQEIEPSLVSR